ncbi:MAG TPA: class II aldolase/adducin family protein [Gemmatimonadaceae bacterium]
MRGTLAARREIVEVCRRLWERGLIAGPDGNVSVRAAGGRVLVTPSGLSKVDVRPADIVELSLDGVPRPGRRARAARRASSEVGLHLRIYARRDDVHAVVHAHPPTATGFAVAGEDFMAPVLPEIILQCGGVPLVPYATPGTAAVADGVEPFLDRHDVFLMANHGATTVGASLRIAHQRMESLEHVARILLTARLLGRVRPLSDSEAASLHAVRAAASRAR